MLANESSAIRLRYATFVARRCIGKSRRPIKSVGVFIFVFSQAPRADPPRLSGTASLSRNLAPGTAQAATLPHATRRHNECDERPHGSTVSQHCRLLRRSVLFSRCRTGRNTRGRPGSGANLYPSPNFLWFLEFFMVFRIFPAFCLLLLR